MSDSFRSAKSSSPEVVKPKIVKPSNLIAELRKLYNEEKKVEDEQAKIPKLDMLPDNRLRISDRLVLKSTTRYISLAKTIQKDNIDKSQDTVWFLAQVFGRMNPSLQFNDTRGLTPSAALASDLDRKINQLLSGSYKIDGRKVNSIMIERGSFLTYSPLEAEAPSGTVRLTGRWALKASKDFLDKFEDEVDARKYMKYGYSQMESRNIYSFMARIDKLDDIEGVKVVIVEMTTDLHLVIPEDFDIIEIPAVNSGLLQAVHTKEYIELKRLLVMEGLSEYPELVWRINEKANQLKLQKDILTDVMVIHHFENYDFEPPSISRKIDVHERLQRERELEMLRRKPFLSPKKAIETVRQRRGKEMDKTVYVFPENIRKLEPELEQYTRKEPIIETTIWDIKNVYVPESLRRVVRQHLSSLGSKGDEIEQAFYDSHGYIEPYILGIAMITSNLDSFLSLKGRIMNGDLSPEDLVKASRKDLLPELFFNDKLVADKREFGRLVRMFEDKQAEEANSLLQLWQPAVKKEWFPVSIAPNPFNPAKWLIDPVGQTCATEKIYVMTADGIKCLGKSEIRDNLEKYLPYNRKDLATLIV